MHMQLQLQQQIQQRNHAQQQQQQHQQAALGKVIARPGQETEPVIMSERMLSLFHLVVFVAVSDTE